MNSAGKTYARELVVAVVVYVLLLAAMVVLLGRAPEVPWRVALVLVPVAPLLFVLRAFVRFLGQVDELQRRIQIDALAAAFGATALLTFSYGFLELAGLPRLSWFFVWPLMALLWAVALAVQTRRYQ